MPREVPPSAAQSIRLRCGGGLGPPPLTSAGLVVQIEESHHGARSAPDFLRLLGDFSELLAVRERAELLQALVLDLPDPLPRHVERTTDLVQRPRLFAVEPVAHLEDPLFPRGKRTQD